MLKLGVNKSSRTAVTDEATGSGSHEGAQLAANDTVERARGPQAMPS